MLDYFVGEVICPYCQNNGGQPVEIVLQTKLRDDADGTSLRVGYVFEPADLEHTNILESGYLKVTDRSDARSARIADAWSCSTCEAEPWAIVEIGDLRITRFSAIILSRSILDSVHYVSEMHAEFLAASSLDLSLDELDQQSLPVVEILRRHLP